MTGPGQATHPVRGLNSSKCLPSSQLPGLMKYITMHYTTSHYTVSTANMSYYPFTECLISYTHFACFIHSIMSLVIPGFNMKLSEILRRINGSFVDEIRSQESIFRFLTGFQFDDLGDAQDWPGSGDY